MAGKDNWGYYQDEEQKRRVNLLPYLLVAILAGLGLAYYQFVPERYTTGLLYDAYSRQPMAGVVVSVTTNLPLSDTNPIPALRHDPTLTATTDLSGTYTLKNLPPDAVIHIAADGYTSEAITLSQAIGLRAFERAMQPVALRGRILDASTGKPVPAAFILIGEPGAMAAARNLSPTVNVAAVGAMIADPDGSFLLTLGNLNLTRTLMIKAPGYRVLTATVAATSTVTYHLDPFQARAIYVNSDSIATPSTFAHLLELADQTGVNAFVIEIKEPESGTVLYDSQSATVLAGGQVSPRFNLDDVVATLKEHHIYAIARIATFLDPAATTRHPDWAIQSISRRVPWTDANGSRWLNPLNPAAVQYNLAVAKEVVARGFDEVQFDSAWFPTAGNLDDADTGAGRQADALQAFYIEAQKAVGPLGGFVAANTYGLVVSNKGDQGGGQELESLAAYADYICPTLFPTSYGKGFLGYDLPEQHPAEIIAWALKRSQARISLLHGRVRPWLQAFASNNVSYGPNEVKAQTATASQYNTSGWMLWNYGNNYDPAALGNRE